MRQAIGSCAFSLPSKGDLRRTVISIVTIWVVFNLMTGRLQSDDLNLICSHLKIQRIAIESTLWCNRSSFIILLFPTGILYYAVQQWSKASP